MLGDDKKDSKDYRLKKKKVKVKRKKGDQPREGMDIVINDSVYIVFVGAQSLPMSAPC